MDMNTPMPPAPSMPPPPKKRSRGKIAAYVVGGVFVVGVISTLANPPSSSTVTAATNDAPTSAAAPTTTAPVETTTAPTPTPEDQVQGKYGVESCNVSSSDNNHLIGSTRVQNTGTVDFTAEVTFTWQNGDGSKVTATPKNVTVAAGRDKLVFFNTPVGGIDAQLNFQDNPDYFHGNKACSSKVTIKG